MSKAKTAKLPARNLSTFRATHDPSVARPTQIKDALTRMAAEYGKDWYMYEHKNPAGAPDSPTFAAYSSVPTTALGGYRTQFLAHIVRTKDNANAARFVWFATPAAALAARGRAASPADLL